MGVSLPGNKLCNWSWCDGVFNCATGLYQIDPFVSLDGGWFLYRFVMRLLLLRSSTQLYFFPCSISIQFGKTPGAQYYWSSLASYPLMGNSASYYGTIVFPGFSLDRTTFFIKVSSIRMVCRICRTTLRAWFRCKFTIRNGWFFAAPLRTYLMWSISWILWSLMLKFWLTYLGSLSGVRGSIMQLAIVLLVSKTLLCKPLLSGTLQTYCLLCEGMSSSST